MIGIESAILEIDFISQIAFDWKVRIKDLNRQSVKECLQREKIQTFFYRIYDVL